MCYQSLAAPCQFLPVYTLSMILCGGKHPSGQFWTSVFYQHCSYPKSKTAVYKLLRRKTNSIPAQTPWFPSTPTPWGSYFLYYDRVADKTGVEEGNPAFADCWGDLWSGTLNESSWDTFLFIIQQQFLPCAPLQRCSQQLPWISVHWFLPAAPQGYFCQLEISNPLNFALKIGFVYLSLPLFLFFCCRELLVFEMCPVIWGSRCIYGSFCDDV